jgi:hypothetical protein
MALSHADISACLQAVPGVALCYLEREDSHKKNTYETAGKLS